MRTTPCPGRPLTRRTLLAGAAAFPVLSGCSRLSGSDSSGGGDQTLKWAQFYTKLSGPAAEANKRWLQTVKTAFEQENGGWRVELEGYTWDQLDQRLILDLRAGVSHDVSLASPQLMGQHAGAGTLLDLTPYVQKWADAGEFKWSPVWKSGLLDGKQLGIPLGVATRGVAYRRAAFDRAGLSPEGLETLDDIVKLAKAAKNQGQPGLLMYLGPERGLPETTLAPLVWHFGGDIFDTNAKEASFASDAGVDAVAWLRSLVHVHGVTPPSAYAPTAVTDDVVMKQFVNSQAGASWGFGNYWIQALNEAKLIKDCYPVSSRCAPDKVDVVPIPTKDQAMFTNAWMVSIGAQSTKADMAWKLIETMLRADHLRAYPDAGMPARLSEYQRPEYATPFYKTWQTIAKKGRGMPATPYYAQLADTIAAAVQQTIGAPSSDIKGILAKAENEWNTKHGGK
jgi:ABC-type glycerol-3-phosphate transport system substrate-binding protein